MDRMEEKMEELLKWVKGREEKGSEKEGDREIGRKEAVEKGEEDTKEETGEDKEEKEKEELQVRGERRGGQSKAEERRGEWWELVKREEVEKQGGKDDKEKGARKKKEEERETEEKVKWGEGKEIGGKKEGEGKVSGKEESREGEEESYREERKRRTEEEEDREGEEEVKGRRGEEVWRKVMEREGKRKFQIEDETEDNAEIADDETELLNETEDNVEVADDETKLLNETEGNAEVADDKTELLNDPIEEIKNDMLEGRRKAMLTQVTNAENDGYYEQYTIYPLYEKKANKTATALYQMLKIQDLPLNNRRKVIRRCRFGFPRPVTETLNIRDVATSIAGRKQLKHKSRLYDLPRTDNEAFETAKQLVQQCLDDDLQKQQSQDDPENAIGIQNIEAGEAMQDFKDLGDRAIQEIDVSDMIVKLNTDQKRVFDKVTNAIESDKSILRLYVSGEGGTGKSFLIKTIKCWIKQNLNKDTAVTAPTGIAAFNINGLTVHRLLQLPVEHGQTP
ncbi:serrate RNA effector molecule homolog, partial [Nylanderia fulva]|uniref:serrate RNA effector molecule homolog n=1 Tax=Nylanderia fulva TaxID=613905 RepID=UPI0010FB1356